MANPVRADRLTHNEETVADEIEKDLAKLFDKWGFKGFPKNVVVPMALLLAIDEAKRSGISYKSVLETLQMVFGRKLS
jgi:hypothetical protein